MTFDRRKLWQKLGRLVISPGLEPIQQAARIHSVERDIVLPIKGLIILTLLYYFYFSNWFDHATSTREVAFDTIRRGFPIYVAVNVLFAAVLIRLKHIPLTVLQWTIYTMGLLDGLLLAALTFVTEGFDSIVFWLFLPLLLRNSITVPHIAPQIGLNLAVSICYVLAGAVDLSISQDEGEGIELATRVSLDIGLLGNPTEPFLLRIMILMLCTFCFSAVQVLFEKHRRAVEEAVEFATRQEQLQTAGRLAAEIAHRLKNPLSIINNSAFSLERSLRDARNSSSEQLGIIREEVSKADRILTELMGYAQLAEGRVEKLEIPEELDRAIHEVFPRAAGFGVQVKREYAPALPYVMMQRGHLSEVFLNILKNAREAVDGKGEIVVRADHGENFSVVVTIEDSGPGIPPDKVERVFEAYFSTKEKGTGLGLSIVKHNIEMYGGHVRVESALGKGARFILQFPVKTVMKLSQ
jgi:signal transduction histidine kinase